MLQGEPTLEFLPPPRMHNDQGQVRRAGFEMEYSGVDVERSAQLVQEIFGGDHVCESTFVHRITNTRFGGFQVEIDTRVLKDKTYEKVLRGLGIEIESINTQWLEKALLGTFSTVVPIEIAAPPIPITDLSPLDALRRRLYAAGAKGTRASLLYAFGMHINPEIPSREPTVLLDYLRAFLLLYPWMKKRAEVDITRSISPYINAFPIEYARLVLQPDYPAGRLVEDYLALNPTRNRPLDMLPILALLDEARVRAAAEEIQLVKARPAFHYRLPNCMIDEPTWSLAQEWNRWIAVERLANDPQRIARMSRDFHQADSESFRPFIDKWPDVLEQQMG